MGKESLIKRTIEKMIKQTKKKRNWNKKIIKYNTNIKYPIEEEEITSLKNAIIKNYFQFEMDINEFNENIIIPFTNNKTAYNPVEINEQFYNNIPIII